MSLLESPDSGCPALANFRVIQNLIVGPGIWIPGVTEKNEVRADPTDASPR